MKTALAVALLTLPLFAGVAHADPQDQYVNDLTNIGVINDTETYQLALEAGQSLCVLHNDGFSDLALRQITLRAGFTALETDVIVGDALKYLCPDKAPSGAGGVTL